MKTDIDIIDSLYLLLNVTDVKAAITGKVCKFRRPINSGKVDIVINCLPATNTQLQIVFANVNIHVPNLKLKSDSTQPDAAKLRTLTNLVLSKIQDQFPDYGVRVVHTKTYPEDEINEHYSNIKLEITNINL